MGRRTISQGGMDRRTSSEAASKKSLSEASVKDVSRLTLAAPRQAESGDGPYNAEDVMRQQGDDFRLRRVRP